MTDERINLLQKWLTEHFSETLTLETASADASFRRYFRITRQHNSYIVMDAPPEHEDTKPFVKISNLLTDAGVNAPFVHAQNDEDGFLLLDDLGNKDYLPSLNDSSADRLYADAFKSIVSMQNIVNTDSLPRYDSDLLEQEMDLFETWFLNKHLEISLDESQKEVLRKTKAFLVYKALEQPQAFVHRDFHSRNLMITEQNNPGVIDFQDAVKGPITYDLVSLLRDCYISWPDDQVYDWVSDFYKMSDRASQTKLSTFKQWFDLMGLQRHIKVLGIFARLYHRDGKSGYLKDLPLTWRYTKMIASRYPELADFNKLLDELMIETRLSS